jgi:SAM-dependent methyltransferase
MPDHEGNIQFKPRLYRQRYSFTLDWIERDATLHSLLDIGCGTCQLLTIGKYRNPHIQLITGIDIARAELDDAYVHVQPLPIEYMCFRRETPLHMYIVHGKLLSSRIRSMSIDIVRILCC